MINSLITVHSYLILNGAIALGYIIVRFIFNLPLFSQKILQAQRLKFARYSFLTIGISFFLIPSLLTMIPASYHSNFQLEPVLENASITFLQHHHLVNEARTPMVLASSFFSIKIFLMIMLFIGTSIFLVRYIKSLFTLKKIQQDSFCQHEISNTQILFNDKIEIPFCWSLLNNHFIAIPHALLEKNNDLKLAISHELQHIRQGDTYWLHILILIKSFCFWNPFITLWTSWFDELQEFSCDEYMVLRKKISPETYAQCLINTASSVLKNRLLPCSALGMHGVSRSILYKRVNMLFNYQKDKRKKLPIISAYMITFFATISAAYAFNGSPAMTPLSTQQVTNIIKKSHLDKSLQISATPEVVNEINNIRSSAQARSFMRESLQRMQHYQPFIQEALKNESMPRDLLVVPLVESAYKPLKQNETPLHTAGIWQFIPSTAQHFGLVVNRERDDRLNLTLSTRAALTYLQANHQQFGDWKLAFIAYEIGETMTDKLIKVTNSHDAWVLARASAAPENLKKTLAMFDAELIIIHNPSLISDKG